MSAQKNAGAAISHTTPAVEGSHRNTNRPNWSGRNGLALEPSGWAPPGVRLGTPRPRGSAFGLPERSGIPRPYAGALSSHEDWWSSARRPTHGEQNLRKPLALVSGVGAPIAVALRLPSPTSPGSSTNRGAEHGVASPPRPPSSLRWYAPPDT